MANRSDADPEVTLADSVTKQTERTLERFYSGLTRSPIVKSALRHAFDQLLQDAVPQPMHIQARSRAQQLVSAEISQAPIVLREFGHGDADVVEAHCTIEAYGSCVANFDAPESDLDMSVDGFFVKHLERIDMLDAPKEWTDQLIESVAVAVEPVALPGSIERVFAARVPVVRFVERKTGTECDICIGNRDAVFKSRTLRELSRVDHRFPDLVRMVKMWARRQGINDATQGSLNSHALTLMALFHLQSVRPPIMPPLADLFDDARPLESRGAVPVDTRVEHFAARCAELGASGYGLANRETTAELFLGMLVRFVAITGAWAQGAAPGVRVSTYRGVLRQAFFEHSYLFLVEDPFDTSDNAARAVGLMRKPSDALGDIVWAFRDGARAAYHVQSKECVTDLMRTLFGSWAARSVDFDGMILDSLDLHAREPAPSPPPPPPPAVQTLARAAAARKPPPPPLSQRPPPPARRRGSKARARALDQFSAGDAGAAMPQDARELRQEAQDLASAPAPARGEKGKQLRGLHDAMVHLKEEMPQRAARSHRAAGDQQRRDRSSARKEPAQRRRRRRRRQTERGDGGKHSTRFGFSAAVDPGGNAAPKDGAASAQHRGRNSLGLGSSRKRQRGRRHARTFVSPPDADDTHPLLDESRQQSGAQHDSDAAAALLYVGGAIDRNALYSMDRTTVCRARVAGCQTAPAGFGRCQFSLGWLTSARSALVRCDVRLRGAGTRRHRKSARSSSRAGALMF